MMHSKGLTKLMEECGELIQIAAKKAAFIQLDHHPDGSLMDHRMQEEIADVEAAIEFVKENFKLDEGAIQKRKSFKLSLFRAWNSEGN